MSIKLTKQDDVSNSNKTLSRKSTFSDKISGSDSIDIETKTTNILKRGKTCMKSIPSQALKQVEERSNDGNQKVLGRAKTVIETNRENRMLLKSHFLTESLTLNSKISLGIDIQNESKIKRNCISRASTFTKSSTINDTNELNRLMVTMEIKDPIESDIKPSRKSRNNKSLQKTCNNWKILLTFMKFNVHLLHCYKVDLISSIETIQKNSNDNGIFPSRRWSFVFNGNV